MHESFHFVFPKIHFPTNMKKKKIIYYFYRYHSISSIYKPQKAVVKGYIQNKRKH